MTDRTAPVGPRRDECRSVHYFLPVVTRGLLNYRDTSGFGPAGQHAYEKKKTRECTKREKQLHTFRHVAPLSSVQAPRPDDSYRDMTTGQIVDSGAAFK